MLGVKIRHYWTMTLYRKPSIYCQRGVIKLNLIANDDFPKYKHRKCFNTTMVWNKIG